MIKEVETLNNRDLAILILAVCIQLSLLLALGVECKAFQADYEWNSIVNGKQAIPEEKPTSYFYNKTIELDKELWSTVHEELLRALGLQIAYIIFLILIIWAVFVHEFLFFTYKPLRTRYASKMGVLILYLVLGFMILAALALETSSISEVKDNMIDVHSKMYHQLAGRFFVVEQDYTSVYEIELNEIVFLKDIIGICLHHSIYMQLNPNNNYPGGILSEIKLSTGELYSFERFKELRFCPLEIYKLVSVIFSLLATLFCWIVPCILGYHMSTDVRQEQHAYTGHSHANPVVIYTSHLATPVSSVEAQDSNSSINNSNVFPSSAPKINSHSSYYE